MSDIETVYDSTEIQMKAVGDMLTEQLSLTDLAKPEIVQLLLQREFVQLADLRTSKKEISELRESNQRLNIERENLRVSLAKLEQRDAFSWLEIPIGILSGFAINMLTTNYLNGLGWVLLILSLIILAFLRIPQIIELFSRKARS